MTNSLKKLRLIIYLTLNLFDRLTHRSNRVTILAYHGISESNWYFDISKKVFEEQILSFKKTHYFVTMSQLEYYLKTNMLPSSKPCLLLTFDDGYKNILQISEFLHQQNIKPTVFVLTDPKNANYQELGVKNELLSIKDIKHLSKLGWTIGCHSSTHPCFASLSVENLKTEISDAKKTLEKKLSTKVEYFAYPKGVYTPQIINQISRSKFSLAFSMDDGQLNASSNRFALPRVGIDRSHTISEVKATISPSVIIFRNFIKNSLFKNLIKI